MVNQILQLHGVSEADLVGEAEKLSGLLVKVDGLTRLNFPGEINEHMPRGQMTLGALKAWSHPLRRFRVSQILYPSHMSNVGA